MDGDDEDPDSAGSMHASVFYGFWPRFTADEETGEPDDAADAPAGA